MSARESKLYRWINTIIDAWFEKYQGAGLRYTARTLAKDIYPSPATP